MKWELGGKTRGVFSSDGRKSNTAKKKWGVADRKTEENETRKCKGRKKKKNKKTKKKKKKKKGVGRGKLLGCGGLGNT